MVEKKLRIDSRGLVELIVTLDELMMRYDLESNRRGKFSYFLGRDPKRDLINIGVIPREVMSICFVCGKVPQESMMLVRRGVSNGPTFGSTVMP